MALEQNQFDAFDFDEPNDDFLVFLAGITGSNETEVLKLQDRMRRVEAEARRSINAS